MTKMTPYDWGAILYFVVSMSFVISTVILINVYSHKEIKFKIIQNLSDFFDLDDTANVILFIVGFTIVNLLLSIIWPITIFVIVLIPPAMFFISKIIFQRETKNIEPKQTINKFSVMSGNTKKSLFKRIFK